MELEIEIGVQLESCGLPIRKLVLNIALDVNRAFELFLPVPVTWKGPEAGLYVGWIRCHCHGVIY